MCDTCLSELNFDSFLTLRHGRTFHQARFDAMFSFDSVWEKNEPRRLGSGKETSRGDDETTHTDEKERGGESNCEILERCEREAKHLIGDMIRITDQLVRLQPASRPLIPQASEHGGGATLFSRCFRT